MFSVLPKVMSSVLPKVSVQSVRSVWFLDVAWSDAFGVALSDAGTWLSYFSEGVKHVETTNQIMNMGLIDPNKRWTSDCSWSFHVISEGNLHKFGCKKCACLARSTDADEARPYHFFRAEIPSNWRRMGVVQEGCSTNRLYMNHRKSYVYRIYLSLGRTIWGKLIAPYPPISSYFPKEVAEIDQPCGVTCSLFLLTWGGQSRDNLFDMFDQYLDLQFRHGNRVLFMYFSECVNPFINQINKLLLTSLDHY